VNANAEFRTDGLLTIWRDLITEPVWKYEELPPLLLSQVTKLDLLEASDAELSRAMWFWLRRPKLMFHESAALMMLCILIALSIALVHWPGTSMSQRVAGVIIILLEVAVAMYAIGHWLKFLRWRREYERSIDRLIRTLHPGCEGGSAIGW
jgi:hypothetical protein